MGRTRVKICCIASGHEARMAASAGADLLGLVGPMPSGAGVITLDRAAAVVRETPPWSSPVLLTAQTTAGAILAEAAAVGVATVQVVSHIAPDEAQALGRAGIGYIQVVHVEDGGALDLIDDYATHAGAFLLDSGRPAEGELGGTGRVHDWALSRAFVDRAPLPVFLAGGLSPSNVRAAIETVRPFGLDLCTGLRPDGALDAGLLASFMAAVADADASMPGEAVAP